MKLLRPIKFNNKNNKNFNNNKRLLKKPCPRHKRSRMRQMNNNSLLKSQPKSKIISLRKQRANYSLLNRNFKKKNNVSNPPASNLLRKEKQTMLNRQRSMKRQVQSMIEN